MGASGALKHHIYPDESCFESEMTLYCLHFLSLYSFVMRRFFTAFSDFIALRIFSLQKTPQILPLCSVISSTKPIRGQGIMANTSPEIHTPGNLIFQFKLKIHKSVQINSIRLHHTKLVYSALHLHSIYSSICVNFSIIQYYPILPSCFIL